MPGIEAMAADVSPIKMTGMAEQAMPLQPRKDCQHYPAISTMNNFLTETEIRKGFAKIKSLKLEYPNARVLEIEDGKQTWFDMNAEAFDNYCRDLKPIQSRIIFLYSELHPQVNNDRPCWYLDPRNAQTLRRHVGISRAFWANLSASPMSNDCLHHFKCREAEPGRPSVHCYLHYWTSEKPVMMELWAERGSIMRVCLNYPQREVKKYAEFLLDWPNLVLQPLLLDVVMLSRLLDDCERRATSHGNMIGNFERESLIANPDDIEKTLHLVCRQVSSVRGNTELVEQGLNHVTNWSKILESIRLDENEADGDHDIVSFGVDALLLNFRQIIRLCDSIQRRVQLQLDFSMHRTNIQEIRANQELAWQTKDLAEQSRDLGQHTAILARQTTADSASMMTIAAVTMFFLPATFTSSLFSMGFFKWDSGRITASDDAWIYPAVVIPLTILTFGVWFLWLRLRPSKIAKAMEAVDAELELRTRETLEATENSRQRGTSKFSSARKRHPRRPSGNSSIQGSRMATITSEDTSEQFSRGTVVTGDFNESAVSSLGTQRRHLSQSSVASVRSSALPTVGAERVETEGAAQTEDLCDTKLASTAEESEKRPAQHSKPAALEKERRRKKRRRRSCRCK